MITIPFTLGGRFRLGARKADGRLRPLADWQSNLILDGGLDEIAMTSTWLDCCHVGGSDTTPANDQTTLIAPIAATDNRVSANSAASSVLPYRGYSQITWRFAAGAAAGIIKEIGIGSSATLGTPLFSRALVKDLLGNPRSVQVFEDEALEVEYELSVYAPAADITGSILIDGVAVGYRARAASATTALHWAPYKASAFATAGQAVLAGFTSAVGGHYAAYSGDLGGATVSPGGDVANAAVIAPDAGYVMGSHLRKVRLEWDLTTANFAGGIKSFYWRMAAGTGSGGNSLGAYQMQLDAPAMKTDELSFRIDLGISWGRQ